MGHVLRLRVVAEGVETEAQLRYLQRLGCDEVQGFYISQPVSAERVTAMLTENRCWIPKPLSADDRRVLLIVDDDTDVVQALLRQLGSDAYTVLTAQSAGAAFELLATHDVRVVISDQRMSGIDGVGFLSRVRELYPDTVRMLLTAHADLELITEAVNKAGSTSSSPSPGRPLNCADSSARPSPTMRRLPGRRPPGRSSRDRPSAMAYQNGERCRSATPDDVRSLRAKPF
jgi:CheY-like chemotaxis protein